MGACVSMTAQAQESFEGSSRRAVHLPAQPLSDSLRQLGQLFSANVSADDQDIAGRAAGPIEGEYTLQDALGLLLAGSGLRADGSGSGFVIRADAPGEKGGEGIVVTGTRIRGAAIASTTLTYEREAMRDAGQASVAEVLRAIPQNFGGGQNAGVGYNVPGGRGVDLDGGTSINLRGLGSDATLTLLDGRRMSYAGVTQGVDVSALPFGAIERIDVVPDGASALFGSDAVAGVANIILRRGFDGVETSARLAGSTDGGNFQQQYGATAGKTWQSGSLLASYEFARTTAIGAHQRSYAETRTPGVTLTPYLRHHNAALVVRQDLTPNLTFDIDVLYNQRWWKQALPLNTAGNLSVSRADFDRRSESWGAAPSLTLSLPSDWLLTLGGSYGWNRSAFGGVYTYGAVQTAANSGVYRNVTGNVELSGTGKLLELPGGSLKAALGAGYRRNSFRRTGSTTSAFVDAVQDSYYAFGELSVPVFASGQLPALGESLDLSLAARYERYPGVGSVVTPKLGAIYAPSKDLSVKASWGRSFRAPTLYEQYRPAGVTLYSAAALGGETGTTALLVSGGNPDLRPERSTNWSATLDLHPAALAGARLEVSYFQIRYRNRIVTPIPFIAQSLSNAIYAPYLTLDPGLDAQADVLARAGTFINAAGSAYDPTLVAAIVDNSNVNAGRQSARGVDALASYHFDLAGGRLRTAINASYIDSKQQIAAGQAVTQMAGTIFNPPHYRARVELGWSDDRFSALAAINYIGPVRDVRTVPYARVGGMAPVDLTLRYHPDQDHGLLAGIDMIASIQNAFNDKPSAIAVRAYTDTPYDSTNYSPFGRVLSLTVSMKW
jgi:outer membrane receptor protein involved in Fe transport